MEGERPGTFQLRFFGEALLFAAALLGQSPSANQTNWVTGEIAYRVTVIPDGSAGGRTGLRIGDVLAELVCYRRACAKLRQRASRFLFFAWNRAGTAGKKSG